MSKFDEYCRNYKFMKLERRHGILQMTMHTDGGPLHWDMEAQAEFARAFGEVGADPENRLVILTGTGDEFSGPRLDPDNAAFFHGAKLTPSGLHSIHWNARRLVKALLDIEVPMIAVVNGPAKRHADLALMCDIVLAADDATFEDTAHFHHGSIVPGDGINVILTMLMGLNRARYLMLTGQVLTAKDAKDMGKPELYSNAEGGAQTDFTRFRNYLVMVSAKGYTSRDRFLVVDSDDELNLNFKMKETPPCRP